MKQTWWLWKVYSKWYNFVFHKYLSIPMFTGSKLAIKRILKNLDRIACMFAVMIASLSEMSLWHCNLFANRSKWATRKFGRITRLHSFTSKCKHVAWKSYETHWKSWETLVRYEWAHLQVRTSTSNLKYLKKWLRFEGYFSKSIYDF